MINSNNYLIIEKDCPHCHTTGILPQAHCLLCQQIIPAEDEWWLISSDTLPCGHDKEHLTEQFGCPHCLGTGWIEEHISRETYEKMRWQRLSRGITLIMLAIIPTTLFLLVVFQDEILTCGSWWAGLIVPLLLTRIAQ